MLLPPLPPPTTQPPAGSTPRKFTVAADMGHFDKDGKHVRAPTAGTPAQDQLKHWVLWGLQGQQELLVNITQALVLHAYEVTAAAWGGIGSMIVSKGSSVIKLERINLDSAADYVNARKGKGPSVTRAAALLVSNAVAHVLAGVLNPDAPQPTFCRKEDAIHGKNGMLFPAGVALRNFFAGFLLDDRASTAAYARLHVAGYDPFDPCNARVVDLKRMPSGVTLLEIMHAASRQGDFFARFLARDSVVMKRIVAMRTPPDLLRATVLSERQEEVRLYGSFHRAQKKECDSIAKRMRVPPVVDFSSGAQLDAIKFVAQTIDTASQVTAGAAVGRDSHYITWYIMLHLVTDTVLNLGDKALCRNVRWLFSSDQDDLSFTGLRIFLRQHGAPAEEFSVDMAIDWYTKLRARFTQFGTGTVAYYYNLRCAADSELQALTERPIFLPPRLAEMINLDVPPSAENLAAINTAQSVARVNRELMLASFPLPTISPVHKFDEPFTKMSPLQLVELNNYLQGKPANVTNKLLHPLGFYHYQEPVAAAAAAAADDAVRARPPTAAITHPDRRADLVAVLGMTVSLDVANKFRTDSRLRDPTPSTPTTMRFQNVLFNVSDPTARMAGVNGQFLVGSARVHYAVPRPRKGAGKDGDDDDDDDDDDNDDDSGGAVGPATKAKPVLGPTEGERIETLLRLSKEMKTAIDNDDHSPVSRLVDQTWQLFVPCLGDRTTGLFSDTVCKPIMTLLDKVPVAELPLILALIAQTVTSIVYTSDPGGGSLVCIVLIFCAPPQLL